MAAAVLLISCPDQRNITASVTNFVASNNGNIVHADQHIDDQTNTFFMRMEWNLEGFVIARDHIQSAFDPIAKQFQMNWTLHFSDEKARMAIFVSKHLHCLYDLLFRHRTGQLDCEIPLIISNHEDAFGIAQDFGIDYKVFSITKDNKCDQEKQELALLREYNIDLVALARYHQILTSDFIAQYPNQIINIHHSFLPAFVGQKPYAQAYEKGVKIIGATSHYVIEALDQGPIIEQDVVRISHRDTVGDLVRMGEDVEKSVFAKAIRLHLQKKILCYANKTVVFD